MNMGVVIIQPSGEFSVWGRLIVSFGVSGRLLGNIAIFLNFNFKAIEFMFAYKSCRLGK